jgi:hypothetical protein
MRLFIYYDSKGKIISAMKANFLADSLEHPYGQAGEKEGVLELKLSSELEALDCHEISEQYSVDVKTKELKRVATGETEKKSAAKKKPRAQRR